MVFDLCFLSTSQEIGCEEHLRNDLFSVEWDALTQSTFREPVITFAVHQKYLSRSFCLTGLSSWSYGIKHFWG